METTRKWGSVTLLWWGVGSTSGGVYDHRESLFSYIIWWDCCTCCSGKSFCRQIDFCTHSWAQTHTEQHILCTRAHTCTDRHTHIHTFCFSMIDTVISVQNAISLLSQDVMWSGDILVVDRGHQWGSQFDSLTSQLGHLAEMYSGLWIYRIQLHQSIYILHSGLKH